MNHNFSKESKVYENIVNEKNVTDLSFMMFYKHINTVLFGMLLYIVYNIIDIFICVGYMGMFQDELSKHNRNFKKIQWFVLDGDTWYFDESHVLSWIFKESTINSNIDMRKHTCSLLTS